MQVILLIQHYIFLVHATIIIWQSVLMSPDVFVSTKCWPGYTGSSDSDGSYEGPVWQTKPCTAWLPGQVNILISLIVIFVLIIMFIIVSWRIAIINLPEWSQQTEVGERCSRYPCCSTCSGPQPAWKHYGRKLKYRNGSGFGKVIARTANCKQNKIDVKTPCFWKTR